MSMCHFQPQIGPFIQNKFFFGKNHYYYFHLPIDPFYFTKFKKILTWGSRVMRMHHSWAHNGPFAPNNFFGKIINIILIYLLASFIAQNFKKILSADPEFWGCAIFGPKMTHFTKWQFFRKMLISLVSFNHAYLHAKNQSQILIY